MIAGNAPGFALRGASRTRDYPATGRLGIIVLIQPAAWNHSPQWTSSVPRSTRSPAWTMNRASGGGERRPDHPRPVRLDAVLRIAQVKEAKRLGPVAGSLEGRPFTPVRAVTDALQVFRGWCQPLEDQAVFKGLVDLRHKRGGACCSAVFAPASNWGPWSARTIWATAWETKQSASPGNGHGVRGVGRNRQDDPVGKDRRSASRRLTGAGRVPCACWLCLLRGWRLPAKACT